MINKIGVIGAGTMGHGIAETFALHGFNVNLFDIDDAQLAKELYCGYSSSMGSHTRSRNEETADEKVERQAKLCIALENWMKAHHCDASAVQCWDSVEANYGCAACLSMSMMGVKGMPSACETDVMGAVSMLALLKASGVHPIYQDWNNNYKNEPNKCINVHCSNYPACAFSEKPEIGNLDILATTLGTEVSFGALKGRVRPSAMTYLKVTTDDKHGKIKCYLGEGTFTDDPLPTFGGVAVCEVPNLNGLMKHLTMNGYEHHVALAQTNCADALEEALGTYMGWDVYRHS